MQLGIPRSWARHRWPPKVLDIPSNLPAQFPVARVDAWQHVEVSPHIHGLLLAPGYLGVGVPTQLPHDKVEGEGGYLFHANNGHLQGGAC